MKIGMDVIDKAFLGSIPRSLPQMCRIWLLQDQNYCAYVRINRYDGASDIH